MPIEQLTLPSGEKVHFVYLRKWPNLGDMIYLQGVRSGRMREDSSAALTYKAMARTHARRLAQNVEDSIPTIDAVISPPSKRADADVYRKEIVRRMTARDLTSRFSRKGKVNAVAASSVAELFDEFEYHAAGDESDINSMLIVDESVASGHTYAA